MESKLFVDTDLVIAEVQKRPCLYDTRKDQYKSKEIKQNAWREICVALVKGFEDLDPAIRDAYENKIQTKWRSVRDSYIKYKRKLKTNSVWSSTIKLRRYRDKLHFLDELQGQRTNKEFEFVSVETGENVSSPDEQENNEQPAAVEADKSTASKNYPAKNPMTEFEGKLLDILKESKEDDADDFGSFFQSLLPYLKTLTDDQKLLFRFEVMQTLLRIKRKPTENLPLF